MCYKKEVAPFTHQFILLVKALWEEVQHLGVLSKYKVLQRIGTHACAYERGGVSADAHGKPSSNVTPWVSQTKLHQQR